MRRLTLVLVLFLAAAAPAAAAPVRDVSHNGTANAIFGVFDGALLTYTAGLTGTLDHIKLRLAHRAGCDPADEATVAVVALVGDTPAATLAEAQVKASDVPTAGPFEVVDYLDIDPAASPAQIAGTRYGVIVTPGGDGCESWQLNGTTGAQAGHGLYLRSSPGGPWTASGWTMHLETWVEQVAAPAAPSVTVTPASPANAAAVTVSGSAAAGTTVRIYSTADCTGDSVDRDAAAFASPGATRPVSRNATNHFSAIAIDSLGQQSPCSAPATFVEDSAAPAAPSLSGTDPFSPWRESTIRVKGAAENGASVKVFLTGDCSGDPVTGTAAELGGAGIQVTVPADATTQLTARATDAAGNTSPCSNAISYTEDSTAPAAPVLSATTPGGPSSQQDILLRGTAEPGAMVLVYRTADCSGAQAFKTAADLNGAGIALTVPENAVTTFSLRAADGAANQSPCSNALTYVEDSAAPETTLDDGPTATADPSPRLTYRSSEAGASFACRIDDVPAACGADGWAPAAPLADGEHTFTVAATDAAGNTDPTPAVRSFTVRRPAAPAVQASAPSLTAAPQPTLRWDLQGDRPQLLTEKRDISVVAGCGPVTCALDVSGTVSVPGASAVLRLAGAKASVGPWKLVRLRLRTTKALRAAVRRTVKAGRTVTVAVRLTATTPGAAPVTRTARIRVRSL